MTRLSNRLVAAVIALMMTACAEVVLRAVPKEADRVARAYLVALHDSGATGVVARTKGTTADLPRFAEEIARMRSMLPAAPFDSIELREFEVLRETGKPLTTRLLYTVRGRGAAVEAELWVEEPKGGAIVVETIRVGGLGS
jgi:hypothetical protein